MPDHWFRGWQAPILLSRVIFIYCVMSRNMAHGCHTTEWNKLQHTSIAAIIFAWQQDTGGYKERAQLEISVTSTIFSRYCPLRPWSARSLSNSLRGVQFNNDLERKVCGLMDDSRINLEISIIEALNSGWLTKSRKQWKGILFWMIHQNY